MTDTGTRIPDAAELAAIGIGSFPLERLSEVRAPQLTPEHPRVLTAAVGPGSLPAAVAAGNVVDPEIPVLTIADLGVLRRVEVNADGSVDVDITPTYSGCPASVAMSADIRRQLADAGYPLSTVHTVLAPAWTTDDMTDAGRDALQRFGIAPPGPVVNTGPVDLTLSVPVGCPRCGSRRTRQTSRFGSTSCKAMRVCEDCAEPFDHFKSL